MTTQEFKTIEKKSKKLAQKGSKIKKYEYGDITYYATPDTMKYLWELKDMREDEGFKEEYGNMNFDKKRDCEQELKDNPEKFEKAMHAIFIPLKLYAYMREKINKQDRPFVFKTWRSVEEIGEYFNLAGMEFEDENGERINYGDGEKYRKACWDLGKSQIEDIGGVIFFPNIGSLLIF